MRVGLTGVLGCGKSTAARCFEAAGFAYIDTDALANHLLQKDASVRAALQGRFGEGLFDGEGRVRKALLAEWVFGPASENSLLAESSSSTQASQPAKPPNPTNPTKPTEPSDSAEPPKPTKPTEPSQIAESGKLTEPNQPNQPNQPSPEQEPCQLSKNASRANFLARQNAAEFSPEFSSQNSPLHREANAPSSSADAPQSPPSCREANARAPSCDTAQLTAREQLRWLEELLHPRVRRLWQAQMESARCPCIVEIPLLFEKNLEKHFDFTLCVSATRSVCLQRLALRGLGTQAALARMQRQFPLFEKCARADYVLCNTGSLEFLNQQCTTLRKLLGC